MTDEYLKDLAEKQLRVSSLMTEADIRAKAIQMTENSKIFIEPTSRNLLLLMVGRILLEKTYHQDTTESVPNRLWTPIEAEMHRCADQLLQIIRH